LHGKLAGIDAGLAENPCAEKERRTPRKTRSEAARISNGSRSASAALNSLNSLRVNSSMGRAFVIVSFCMPW
jgi:hypothetical protein